MICAYKFVLLDFTIRTSKISPDKFHTNNFVLDIININLWSMCASFNRMYCRCGNVAAILELDEYLQRDFTIFEAAPQESRGIPTKKPQPDYFL